VTAVAFTRGFVYSDEVRVRVKALVGCHRLLLSLRRRYLPF
jgi:hypothetical protein